MTDNEKQEYYKDWKEHYLQEGCTEQEAEEFAKGDLQRYLAGKNLKFC